MKKSSLFLIFLSLSVIVVSASAQSKRKPPRKTAPKIVAIKTEAVPAAVKPEILPPAPAKKNERSENAATSENQPKKANAGKTAEPIVAAPAPFVYEFSQPAFYIFRVRIEHDADGKGKITFERQDLDGAMTDPLQISPTALARIKTLYDELKFLDSSENYQSAERDYKHLGTMRLVRTEGDSKREAEFNWTENLTARSLTDEYKKLTEQFVWIFEINVARENQPLESPKLMDKIERLIEQNQISDIEQIVPFLRELANDERLPLIARNHATKIVYRVGRRKK